MSAYTGFKAEDHDVMVYWDNEPRNPWDVVEYESNNISDACEADRVALEFRVDGVRYFIETAGHKVERD